eukprot:7543162-Karenia_brevis.AAC.1
MVESSMHVGRLSSLSHRSHRTRDRRLNLKRKWTCANCAQEELEMANKNAKRNECKNCEPKHHEQG